MARRRFLVGLLLVAALAGRARAQDAAPANPSASEPDPALMRRGEPPAKIPPNESVALIVPKGTPLKVAVDTELRIRKVGQAVHARTLEPVYAFDQLVIPVGAELTGQITKIDDIPKGARTAAALDADFTPAHKVHVEFTEITLSSGRHAPIQTIVTPGTGQVMRLVTAAGEKSEKSDNLVAQKAKQAKQEARREWETALKQVKEPGKTRRVEKYLVAQLPVHPQYLDAGTMYFAELESPLDFGTRRLTPEIASSLGGPLPPGSYVHAYLLTPLDSATTKKGDEVEAILSRPLFDGDKLILPQGSRLKGLVVQAQPARHLSRNGQLRLVFHDLLLPDGVQQKVDAVLEGVQAAKSQNVKLDAEGGAEARSPAVRFLTTGISIGLGATSFLGDTFGDTGPRVAGGAGGYKLIGIGLGAAIHSQQFGMAMGVFGATRSVYTNFLARGQEIVFPKFTAMQIGISTRPETPASSPQPPAAKPSDHQ